MMTISDGFSGHGLMERRSLLGRLGAAAVLPLAFAKPTIAANFEQEHTMTPLIDAQYNPPGNGVVTGKGSGDFDFLTGEWLIRHRRRPDMKGDEWLEFESGATVHRVLNGMGSIEELRKADGSDMGMGVRVWLPEEKKWADHWTSAATGIVGTPQKGEFIDGEGVFISGETLDGVDWLYRGVWDQIGDGRCRCHQSVSKDGGKSWDWNWWMMWTRVAKG
jgi:hypothetical protein